MQLVRLVGRSYFVRWFLFFPFLGIFIPTTMATAPDKVVTAADKGGLIHVRTGGSFEVRLPSNPSTGYMWYVEKESTPLLRVARQWQTEPTERGVGRPVFQVFKFEGRRRGTGVLRMHYVRSWEPPTPGDEKFDLRVAIE